MDAKTLNRGQLKAALARLREKVMAWGGGGQETSGRETLAAEANALTQRIAQHNAAIRQLVESGDLPVAEAKYHFLEGGKL